VVQSVVSALRYLREHKKVPIIHRDIKPENILIHYDKTTKAKTFKLGDFGWAVQHVPSSVRTTLCGTPDYLPPEVALENRYSGGFDIWTLGVLLYEMLTGITPFSSTSSDPDEHTMDAIIDRVKAGKFTIPDTVGAHAKDLIKGMLQLDPSKRFGLEEIEAHPWMGGKGVDTAPKTQSSPATGAAKPVEEPVVEPVAKPVEEPVVEAVASSASSSSAEPAEDEVAMMEDVADDDELPSLGIEEDDEPDIDTALRQRRTTHAVAVPA